MGWFCKLKFGCVGWQGMGKFLKLWSMLYGVKRRVWPEDGLNAIDGGNVEEKMFVAICFEVMMRVEICRRFLQCRRGWNGGSGRYVVVCEEIVMAGVCLYWYAVEVGSNSFWGWFVIGDGCCIEDGQGKNVLWWLVCNVMAVQLLLYWQKEVGGVVGAVS